MSYGPKCVLKWIMQAPVMDFEMPEGSVVLTVEQQHGVPTLWTLGRVGGPTERRTFLGFGTGHPIFEDGLLYVGTAHDVEGEGLVFHIFERPSPRV
jgi:hypothetical protein